MDPAIPHDQVRMVIAALRLLQNDILYRKLDPELAEEVIARRPAPPRWWMHTRKLMTCVRRWATMTNYDDTARQEKVRTMNTSIKSPATDAAIAAVLDALRGLTQPQIMYVLCMTTTGAIGASNDPDRVFERYTERLRDVLQTTLAARATSH